MAEGNIPLVARIMVQHGGAGSGTGSTGMRDARRQQTAQKNMQQTAEKSNAIQGTSLLKMGGMLAGIGLLVGFTVKLFKNSQVTKSVFGAVFQILGAMMDMLLMPLLPLIVPLLQKMAGWLPKVAEFGQRVAVHVQKFIDIWEKEGWKEAMSYAWETVAQPIFDHIVDAVIAAVKALWDKITPDWMDKGINQDYKNDITKAKNQLRWATGYDFSPSNYESGIHATNRAHDGGSGMSLANNIMVTMKFIVENDGVATYEQTTVRNKKIEETTFIGQVWDNLRGVWK